MNSKKAKKWATRKNSKPATPTKTNTSDEVGSGDAILPTGKDVNEMHNKPLDQPSKTERPQRKSVPILDRQDAVVLTTNTDKMQPTGDVAMFKKPILIMTEASMEDPDDENYMYVEGVGSERPTHFEPRVRRVSDVIDSRGDGASLPGSPRFKTFAEGSNSASLPSTPRLPMAFIPDWLKPSAVKVDDDDDTVVIERKGFDATDAAPMNSTSTFIEDEDNNMPRTVIANLSVEKDSEEYNMNHKRRGRAIIFNHDTFENGYTDRPGSEVDAKNLDQTFTQLQFEVMVYHNLEHQEIKTVINNLVMEDHSDADCLVITVLTHGMQNGYILSKDVPYPVDYLWRSFKADICPTLAGKPKIFFIQACRGDALDSGVHMMRQSRTQTDSAASDYKLPSHADFLVAHGTVDGQYAFRNTETGTWFIECLCNELKTSGASHDLLKMLTRTARRVAVDYQSFSDIPWQNEMKQVPSITTMLIRDVFFRPKTVHATDDKMSD